MKKTKAALKALREECGLSQQDIADEAGVNILAVKRWENPEYPGRIPPDDVWQFLLQARGAMYQDAREIADQIIESLSTIEKPQDLQLDYFRKQEDLDAVQLESGIDEPVGYYNARMRLVGQLLDKAEIPYTYRYPTQ